IQSGWPKLSQFKTKSKQEFAMASVVANELQFHRRISRPNVFLSLITPHSGFFGHRVDLDLPPRCYIWLDISVFGGEQILTRINHYENCTNLKLINQTEKLH
ncbi:Protein lev-9, partial [Araneus ventricosus]